MDYENLGKEIKDMIQNAVEDVFDDLEATIDDSIEAAVQNAFQNMLSDLELVTPDGTHIVPRKKMRLISPDKTKVLLCYGGLRIDDTSKFSGNYYPTGWGLTIQTRVDSWEPIFIYDSKEKAVLALESVNKALNDGVDSFEL